MQRLRDRILERFAGIDVWFNDAGREVGRCVLELTDPEFDEIIDVNLRSVYFVVLHLLSRGLSSGYIFREPGGL